MGQKSVEASQKISEQAQQKTAEKYDSIIGDFIKIQIEENIELVKKEIDEIGIK